MVIFIVLLAISSILLLLRYWFFFNAKRVQGGKAKVSFYQLFDEVSASDPFLDIRPMKVNGKRADVRELEKAVNTCTFLLYLIYAVILLIAVFFI